MTGQWRGSQRKSQLPPDWSRRRRRILQRDGYRCRAPGCAQRATDVDHIKRGPDHSDANLQSLCGWHHRQKSSSEGGKSRPRYSRKRAEETHPGLTHVKKQRPRSQAVKRAQAAQ